MTLCTAQAGECVKFCLFRYELFTPERTQTRHISKLRSNTQSERFFIRSNSFRGGHAWANGFIASLYRIELLHCQCSFAKPLRFVCLSKTQFAEADQRRNLQRNLFEPSPPQKCLPTWDCSCVCELAWMEQRKMFCGEIWCRGSFNRCPLSARLFVYLHGAEPIQLHRCCFLRLVTQDTYMWNCRDFRVRDVKD